MPGTVIGKSLNMGYAGKITRNVGNIVGARFSKSILDGSNNETLPNIPFGSAVVLNTDNTYSLFGASGAGVANPTAANFAGIAVAEVKQVYNYLDSSKSDYIPATPVDVLQEGSGLIFINDIAAVAPVAGGQVFIVTVKGAGAFNVGAFVTSATPTGGGTAVSLTNVKFTTGKVDANGLAEVSILLRNNP